MIGAFSLPWLVIVLALVLAVVATFVAASRPARAITRIPVVTALSGRPAPPKRVRRSAIPGLVLLAVAFALLAISPGSGQNAKGNPLELVLGLVALIGGGDPAVPRCAWRCWPGSAAAPRSRCASPCATCRATGPARARRSPRSASAC